MFAAQKAVLHGVSLSLPTTEYRRGDSIEATVRIDTSPAPDALTVGLVCTEHCLDTSADAPSSRRSTQWEEWQPLALGAALWQRVSFRIPDDAPYSHEGRVLSVSWAVVVRQPRRLRFDPTVVEPIWTSP